jgi:hypothetical protein
MKSKIFIEDADFIQVGKAPSQLERIAMHVAIHQQAIPMFRMNDDDFKLCISQAKRLMTLLNLEEMNKKIEGVNDKDEWVKK